MRTSPVIVRDEPIHHRRERDSWKKPQPMTAYNERSNRCRNLIKGHTFSMTIYFLPHRHIPDKNMYLMS